MGKGKGSPEYWVAVIKPGRILFELEGLDEAGAQAAFKTASHKLPVKTKMVSRRELGHSLKKDELKKLSKSELVVKLNENQDALMNFRFQKVLQQLEKPQAIRSVKREIAQIKTVIRELELGIRGKEVK